MNFIYNGRSVFQTFFPFPWFPTLDYLIWQFQNEFWWLDILHRFLSSLIWLIAHWLQQNFSILWFNFDCHEGLYCRSLQLHSILAIFFPLTLPLIVKVLIWVHFIFFTREVFHSQSSLSQKLATNLQFYFSIATFHGWNSQYADFILVLF